MPEIRTERVRANGLEFHVNVCGEGDRLALCLHGFPELGYSWRHQLPVLASAGYRAWAPDLRGFGQSDRPKGLENYAIERLLEDVAGLIDASGAKETMLLAHDWGAMIAWQCAAHRVRPLERLVIMNGPPPGVRRPGRISLQQLRRSWYVYFLQLPWLPERVLAAQDYRVLVTTFTGRMAGRPDCFSEEELQVYKQAAAQPGALTAMVNYYRGLLRGGGAKRVAERGFPVIEIPTLMIWGAADPVLIPSTTNDAQKWVKDLTRRFIPSAGHWVQHEAPEHVNEMLAAWLSGEPVPGESAAPSGSLSGPGAQR